jgi:hypothetical protein
MRAAYNGCTDIFDYVIEQGEVLDAESLTNAFNHAGTSKSLRAAQWLRQHGAEWPLALSAGEEPYIHPWSADMIAWARAEDCTSPAVL